MTTPTYEPSTFIRPLGVGTTSSGVFSGPIFITGDQTSIGMVAQPTKRTEYDPFWTSYEDEQVVT